MNELFKISKVEYVNKTFRIPKDLLEKLQIFAGKNHVSVNELVIQCCEYAMDNTRENSDETT